MRVYREACAASILFFARRLHDDGIFQRSCRNIGSAHVGRVVINRTDNEPSLDPSSGVMSKISIPCIFPRISNLSKPVACSRSVGTVPGLAPGARRSDSVLISTLFRKELVSVETIRGK